MNVAGRWWKATRKTTTGTTLSGCILDSLNDGQVVARCEHSHRAPHAARQCADTMLRYWLEYSDTERAVMLAGQSAEELGILLLPGNAREIEHALVHVLASAFFYPAGDGKLYVGLAPTVALDSVVDETTKIVLQRVRGRVLGAKRRIAERIG